MEITVPVSNDKRFLHSLMTPKGLLLITVTAILLALLPGLFAQPHILAFDDFVVYWASGRLNVLGRNPYDPNLLLPLERAAGRPLENALVMWNPPWTLALVMPLGLLPYPVARTLWFVLHFIALTWSFDHLYRMSCCRPFGKWTALIIGFTFEPVLLALRVGQISPLILTGMVGGLTFFHRRPFVAGLFAALMMVKPQLTYFFFIPFLLWVHKYHRKDFLIGIGTALLGAMLIVFLKNPHILLQYRLIWFREDSPIWQATPTIGGILRYLLGPDRTALQWIVPLVGSAWLFADAWRRPSQWSQKEAFALLAVIFPIIATYMWLHDMGIMLVGLLPVLLCLIRPPIKTTFRVAWITLYALMNIIVLTTSWDQLWYFWLGPALLLWFLLARRHLKSSLFLEDRSDETAH